MDEKAKVLYYELCSLSAEDGAIATHEITDIVEKFPGWTPAQVRAWARQAERCGYVAIVDDNRIRITHPADRFYLKPRRGMAA